jgi:hypothetical protein
MFIEAGIDLDNVNEDGDTAMMMTGARSLQSHYVMRLFLEAGAKSCFVNNLEYSLLECHMMTNHGVIVNEAHERMQVTAYIIFNSFCFNFALVHIYYWDGNMGVKRFVKEAFVAERTIVAKAIKDGNKKLKKIPIGVLKIGVLKYL